MTQPSGRNGWGSDEQDAGHGTRKGRTWETWEDSLDPDDALPEAPAKVLTRTEVQALAARYRRLTPGGVLAAQVLVGLVVAGLAAVWVGRAGAALSALYGAAVVVVPGGLMVYALSGPPAASAAAAQLRLLTWTLLRLMVAAGLLAAAVFVVRDLHWPAMLVALVACLKVNGLAPLWQGRTKKT